MDIIHHPLTHEDGKTVFYKDDNNDTYVEAKIISSPINDENEPYTIQSLADSGIHEMMATSLLYHNPSKIPKDPTPSVDLSTFPLLPWIKPEAKTTLWLPKVMKQPKQGILKHDNILDVWSFSPGKTDSHEPIPLPHFKELAQSMVTNKKEFSWMAYEKYSPHSTAHSSNI